MSRAAKCPVCDGKGEVRVSMADPRPGRYLFAGADKMVECPGCKGKGWVEVSGIAFKPRNGWSNIVERAWRDLHRCER